MKLLVVFALIAAGATLLGTRRDTPFMRWGIAIVLVGLLLIASSALFTVRAITFGAVLSIAGVALYYYGRIARHENLFVSKPK